MMGLFGLVQDGHSLIPPHILYSWLVMLILIVLGWLGTRKLSLVPGKIQNFLEILVSGIEDFVVSNIGEKGRSVFPLLMTLFIFILFCNFIGLVPGCMAPTANINTNASMALCVFLFYNFIGLKEHGPKYIKHFTGPIPWLMPLMLPIEFLSHLARPLSLTVRLFGNIFGEELVLLLFFMLLPVIATLPIYFLYSLADTIQAFIFFMLSMIYMKMSFEEAH
ncbi:MAG TPA: F0F1 ATP synthase subunit A [Desulfohalobiaceae bacterium]|nr:F0F1 ATP synthase subunit A [Desulfohalobiaceae bacterium]